MTSCHHIVRLLSAYHDSELSAEQARRVEAHLSQCAACRAQVERFASVSERMKAHPRIEPSPDFDVRVVAAAIAQAQRVTWMDKVEAWLARPLLRLGVSLSLALTLSAAAAWTADRLVPAPAPTSPPLIASVDLDQLDKFYARLWMRQGMPAPHTPLPPPPRRSKGDASWRKDLSSLPSRQFSC